MGLYLRAFLGIVLSLVGLLVYQIVFQFHIANMLVYGAEHGSWRCERILEEWKGVEDLTLVASRPEKYAVFSASDRHAFSLPMDQINDDASVRAAAKSGVMVLNLETMETKPLELVRYKGDIKVHLHPIGLDTIAYTSPSGSVTDVVWIITDVGSELVIAEVSDWSTPGKVEARVMHQLRAPGELERMNSVEALGNCAAIVSRDHRFGRDEPMPRLAETLMQREESDVILVDHCNQDRFGSSRGPPKIHVLADAIAFPNGLTLLDNPYPESRNQWPTILAVSSTTRSKILLFGVSPGVQELYKSATVEEGKQDPDKFVGLSNVRISEDALRTFHTGTAVPDNLFLAPNGRDIVVGLHVSPVSFLLYAGKSVSHSPGEVALLDLQTGGLDTLVQTSGALMSSISGGVPTFNGQILSGSVFDSGVAICDFADVLLKDKVAVEAEFTRRTGRTLGSEAPPSKTMEQTTSTLIHDHNTAAGNRPTATHTPMGTDVKTTPDSPNSTVETVKTESTTGTVTATPTVLAGEKDNHRTTSSTATMASTTLTTSSTRKIKTEEKTAATVEREWATATPRTTQTGKSETGADGVGKGKKA
eukprot:Clim_evm19s33 gene=Clim_evmTU19s33